MTSPAQVDPNVTAARPGGLSRRFDPIFEQYRDGIPIEYLRALAMRESGMNPAERSGPAWGLMQITEVARHAYNTAHRTEYTREHLLDPAVNIGMGCWLLRQIIASYRRHHPDVPNLRANWRNPRFVELLTFGWNAGYSEAAGVGCVAQFLKGRGIEVTLDSVHDYAAAAGAIRHLSEGARFKWCKTVAELYRAEVQHRTSRNAGTGKDRPPVWFVGVGPLNKLYLAQRTYLANLRGADRLAPEPDMTGGVMPVPRSTNADVIQLAQFWTAALDEPKAKNANGYDTVRARWSAVQRDIEALARGADPNAVYPKNHAFWRAASSVAIHVAASIEYGLSDAERWMASVGERVQGVTSQAQSFASSVASGVRDVAADAARGAGKYILIGSGLVAGVLLLRSRARD